MRPNAEELYELPAPDEFVAEAPKHIPFPLFGWPAGQSKVRKNLCDAIHAEEWEKVSDLYFELINERLDYLFNSINESWEAVAQYLVDNVNNLGYPI